jgi:hypothetical protein
VLGTSRVQGCGEYIEHTLNYTNTELPEVKLPKIPQYAMFGIFVEGERAGIVIRLYNPWSPDGMYI